VVATTCASNGVRDDPSGDAPAHLLAKQYRARRLVEGIEPSIDISGEEHATRGRHDPGDDWPVRFVLPANATVGAVDRMDPPRRTLRLVGRETGAHVELAANVFVLAGCERRAPIDGPDVERSRGRIEGGPVPFHSAQHAGARPHAGGRRLLVGVEDCGNRLLEDCGVRPAVDGVKDAIFAGDRDALGAIRRAVERRCGAHVGWFPKSGAFASSRNS
jgi:hypothetical protein